MLHSIPLGILSFSSGGFQVDNSTVFGGGSYLTRTPSGSATSRRKFTMSAWVKRGNLGTNFPIFSARSGVNSDDALNFTTGDKLELMVDYTGDGQLTSNAVFRDPHAWYNVVCAIDTEQSTASNRVKLYVNNEQITSFSTSSYPAEDYDWERWQVSGNENTIGRTLSVSGAEADGYMAEIVWIDGQQLTPSSFGETDSDGVWRPISIEDAGLTFGNYGYYLPFTNSAALGQDYSGSSSETKLQENTYNAGSEVNNGDMSGNPACIAYTAIATAKLATVKINSSSRGFTNVTVQVQTDNGSNAPDGTTLTNGQVTGITGSGSGLKTVNFPNDGPELTAGTKYWICVPSTDLGGGFEWGIQHDVSGVGGALGIIDSTGYQAGRGYGHEVFQLGNIFKVVT